MSSTNKTPKLRLNSWVESDIPKRIDFVADNEIIDNILGSHIGDNDKHLTVSEKDRVSAPYVVTLNQGSGTSSGVYRAGFTPKLAVIFKTASPTVQPMNDYAKINFAIATQKGNSGGAALSEDTLTVTQSTNPVNGVYYNLNEDGATYIIVYFK